MLNNHQAASGEGFGLPRDYPNASCAVSNAADEGWFCCHSFWRSYCPHVVQLGDESWCTQKDAAQIPKLRTSKTGSETADAGELSGSNHAAPAIDGA